MHAWNIIASIQALLLSPQADTMLPAERDAFRATVKRLIIGGRNEMKSRGEGKAGDVCNFLPSTVLEEAGDCAESSEEGKGATDWLRESDLKTRIGCPTNTQLCRSSSLRYEGYVPPPPPGRESQLQHHPLSRLIALILQISSTGAQWSGAIIRDPA